MTPSYTVAAYALYLPISLALTIWVAKTLSRNGRLFLIRTFGGDDKLADSINHLLVVGFYLVNIGYVTLALRYGDKPADLVGMIEFLSWKVGLVLVVLGGLHFLNLFVFGKIAREGGWRRAGRDDAPPLPPDANADNPTEGAAT